MDIAIPLFDGFTALDAIGPYEVLSRLPGYRVRFVAVTAGPYQTDTKQVTLVADDPLSAVPPIPSPPSRTRRSSWCRGASARAPS